MACLWSQGHEGFAFLEHVNAIVARDTGTSYLGPICSTVFPQLFVTSRVLLATKLGLVTELTTVGFLCYENQELFNVHADVVGVVDGIIVLR